MTTGKYTFDVTVIVYGIHADTEDQAYDKVTEKLRAIATDCNLEKIEKVEEE